MGRWINGLAGRGITGRSAVANADDGCSVCDHPFGHLTHACISSIGATVPQPIRLPEPIVA